MILDAALLNTQHYKVGIKGEEEQSRERSSALPYTFKYYYVIPIIQFKHTVKEIQVLLFKTNNSI